MTDRILVCGEALFDLFLADGTDPAALGFDARVGGSPFNVAIGLARQGHQAGLFTGVSRDFLGDRLAAHLAGEGVDTGYLRRMDRPTTLSVVGVDAGGAPAYAFYGAGAADRSITADDLPDLDAGIGALHFGSYSCVVPPAGESFLALARRESHRCISYDPNVRPTIEPDMNVWRDRIAEFAAVADVIKISDEDFELLWPGADPAAQAARWLSGRTALVVLTRGGAPALAWTAAGPVPVPPPPAVEVVDTVGAGDTFQAAMLGQLSRHGLLSPGALAAAGPDALQPVLAHASAAAALTCTRRGADLPRAAEIEAFMNAVTEAAQQGGPA